MAKKMDTALITGPHGSYFRLAVSDQKNRYVVSGGTLEKPIVYSDGPKWVPAPADDKTAIKYLADYSRGAYDADGNKLDLVGPVAAAAFIAKHNSESVRGKIRIAPTQGKEIPDDTWVHNALSGLWTPKTAIPEIGVEPVTVYSVDGVVPLDELNAAIATGRPLRVVEK